MLSITDLHLSIDDHPLITDLTVDVEPGRCLAVVGRNGVGKSTLLRCIAGLRAPRSGTITVGGSLADDTDARFRALVGVELGDDATFAELTVAEHLRLIAAMYALDDHDVDAALVDAGIDHLADRFPHTLSTGQRQRFALCAVFSRPTRVVVIDEPEAGLDADGRAWVARCIAGATADDRVVVMATHSTELIEACSADVLEIGR